jgi:hypothetical protein
VSEGGRVHFDPERRGWFFWDETDAYRHGPWGTRAEAVEEMERYCREELMGESPFEPLAPEIAEDRMKMWEDE